ncbi:unnamed protein product [Strongylus vulgaris]|uniref:Uncharacterized protein n=1 Tax=Strongylus vulgaris TaxID=40348 RepID=A0A3P7JHY7_STRVU|nr:unnamed protein product [Strongylus vulgaris]
MHDDKKKILDHTSRVCACLAIAICVLVWGEWLNYRFSRHSWSIPQPRASESLGVLIVADPQLVGYRNENHMWGPVTRWDSDRWALVVSLEASETEIEWTIERFFDIFDTMIPVSILSMLRILLSVDQDELESYLTTSSFNLLTMYVLRSAGKMQPCIRS